jgi:Integrase core domain
MMLRRPVEPKQYVSIKYTERLAEAGLLPSVGSVRDSYDNALAKTINGLYKAKVIHRRGPWRGIETVEYATLEWVDWFNNRRLLSSIGDIPPAEAEAAYYAATKEPAKLAAGLKRNSLREGRDSSRSSAINREYLTRDPSSLLAGQEECGVGNVGRLPGAARVDAFDQSALALHAVTFPLTLGRRIRAHEPRSNSVAGNAEAAKILRQLFGEPDKRVLRRRVSLDAGETGTQSSTRRNENQAPELLLLHWRRCRLREPECAVYVSLEDSAPVSLGYILDRPAHLATHATGRIDQNVEATVRRHDLLDEIMRIAPLTEVGMVAFEAPGGLEHRPVDHRDIGEMHLGARILQRERDGAADALGRSRYERDFAVEADVHVSINC